MAFICNDRVKETTATTGTGTVSLSGAVTHFEGFSAGIGNSNVTYYCIVHEDTSYNEWEVGYGTYTASGSTLSRTAVTSSNSDSLVNFSAGTKSVFCTLPASKGVIKDTSGNLVYGDGSSTGFLTNIVSDTTPQLGGNLDVNGNQIVSVSNGAIAINANGSGMVTMTSNSIQGDVIPGKLSGTNFSNSLLVGHSTSGTLSTASDNTGIGIAALDALTSGDNNTALGSTAGSAVASGTDNTNIGKDSGKLVTGNYNLTIGSVSGDNLTTGAGNVIIGSVDAASATASRQLKIAGNDGSTTTTWWDGDNTGRVTNSALVQGNMFSKAYGPTGAPITLIVTAGAKTAAHPYYGDGSASGYFINGVESPVLSFGGTDAATANTEYFYEFDQSDSTNSGHTLRFYLDADKTTAYTTGVTVTGTAGSSGAKTVIAVNEFTPNILYYQCDAHAYMGNYASQVTNMINCNGVIYKWPTADATSGFALTTNGSGVLSFTEITGGAAWQAASTTASISVAAGKGYLLDTTSNTITCTLPASPSLGDTVNFIDYAATFDTNNLTVGRNGKRIQGLDADLVVATERAAFALVYSGATNPGWLLTEK